jgi:acetolactate synthase-1/3 small subunit
MTAAIPARTRTLIAHVEDKPGVLARIASLFRRRGYNIQSLTVGRTAEPGVSRLTLMIEADDDTARRIEANLYKLVNVLDVVDLNYTAAVSRELALIKIAADVDTRPRVLQIAEVFHARVIDMDRETVTIESTGTHDQIDGLVDVLRSFEVLDLVRSGVIAMTRGRESTRPQPNAPSSQTSEEHPPWPESSTTATPISA